MSANARERETTAPDAERSTGSKVLRWVLLIVLVGLALVMVAVLALARFVSGFNPFNRHPVDRSQPAVLLALQDLSEYRAATGEFQVIVDLEDNVRNLPLVIAGQRTLFVASGTVDAAVDFSGLGADAVRVDSARREVSITLPHAALTRARVDPDDSYVFSRERGLIDRLAGMFSDEPTSERELYQLAERRLQDAAESSGLDALADQNTELMLRSLLTSLGFEEITVEHR